MSEDQIPAPEAEVEENTVLSIFDVCETDTDAEENGKWFNDVFQDGSNIAVKLRRMTASAVLKARRRLEKQYRTKQQRDGTFPDDVNMEMMVKLLAEAVIVDWKNIRDRDKTVIDYSAARAEELMKKLPMFRDVIAVYSNDLDSFRLIEGASAEKN